MTPPAEPGVPPISSGTRGDLATRFQKGNPGRLPGLRNKRTLAIEKQMADGYDGIVAAVKAAALNGDMVAARIVLDRLSPAPRSRTLTIPGLPQVVDHE